VNVATADSHELNVPYRRADETTDLVIPWLESEATRGEFFLWVHYFDPHRPHQPPERHLDAVLPRNANEREHHVEFLETQHRLDVSTVKLDDIFEYDAEIRFVDAELERLYRALDDRGLNDGAMWIITSDHGQGLGNHGWFGHHKNIYNEQIRAPLVVHFPGHPRRERIDEIVEHVDIAVTLADLLEADLDAQPAPIQGRSLAPLLRGEATGRHREYAFGERRRSDVVVTGRAVLAPESRIQIPVVQRGARRILSIDGRPIRDAEPDRRRSPTVKGPFARDTSGPRHRPARGGRGRSGERRGTRTHEGPRLRRLGARHRRVDPEMNATRARHRFRSNARGGTSRVMVVSCRYLSSTNGRNLISQFPLPHSSSAGTSVSNC